MERKVTPVNSERAQRYRRILFGRPRDAAELQWADDQHLDRLCTLTTLVAAAIKKGMDEQ